MILPESTISEIKNESKLSFDKAKDFESVCTLIEESTKRHIGVTTIKRLFGYINDDRKPNAYTLNTIALFLGFPTWEEYVASKRLDSIIGFRDEAVYIHTLKLGAVIDVKYLNRELSFIVESIDGVNVLRVISAQNSSLCCDDVLFVYRLKVGEIIEAEKLIRKEEIGNYRTNGKITFIEIHPS